MYGRNKKNDPKAVFSLRCYPIDISREHGAFLDVGDAEEAGGDTLEADGEAAVRRHAVSALPLCASLSRRRRIPRTPHGYSAPRPHPLLRGIA